MADHDLEKLLGGFAADTMTPKEREALFRAALSDQQLFNALADEQALKELLADPAVRRRLISALAHSNGAGRWRSWLDRFSRPANLAWAGGVAAAVVAVVLGVRVYENSLREASETAVLEEKRPQVPSAPPPTTPSVEAPLKDIETKAPKTTPLPQPAAKDAVTSSSSTREKAATSRPQQGPRSDPDQAKKRELSPQKESQQFKAPIAALGKSAEQPASSSERPAALPSAPASDVTLPIQASARALFYGLHSASEMRMRDQEQEAEQALKPERFALRKALDKTAPTKPLALRYSFVIREGEGPEREVNAAPAPEQPRTITLRVESNQEAYLQVWTRAGDALPELLLPAKETGRISLKIAEGQRQQMTMPQKSDRLIVRLSNVPFGPITRQEAVMAGRGAPGQVTDPASGTGEQATYVAHPDLSVTELAVEIPVGAKASP